MDLILCHTTADFDTLGAAVGLTQLRPGARIVLTGGAHPAVRDFLALHRDEFPLIERRAVVGNQIRSLTIVDTQRRDRLGKAAEWLNLSQITDIEVYDHHLETELNIPATRTYIEAVGATTTLIVEKLQQELATRANILSSPIPSLKPHLKLNPVEATVMALGIHVDTGSLTFDHATARDAAALAWLMTQGASLPVIAEYIDPGLSVQLQNLLTRSLQDLQSKNIDGYKLSWVLLKTDNYTPGLSSLASRLMDLTESDALLLACQYPVGESADERLVIIGRSAIANTNLNSLFKPLGGGGHPRAATVTLRENIPTILDKILQEFEEQIPHAPVARDLMSSPVRTIRPETTVREAQRILLRYGHSGLSVVNSQDELVGIIARRDLDIALHHGFSHAPVKGYMTSNLNTISPDTPLPEIEELMVTYDIGRLPVIDNGQLVGIVTRTDVLRQLHQDKAIGSKDRRFLPPYCPFPQSIQEILRDRLIPQQWQLLETATKTAENIGCHLYLVGGAVRDLLLAGWELKDNSNQLPIIFSDIDLVVDSYHHTETGNGAGVELAKNLQELYPNCRLEIHGEFQTAALLWHKDSEFKSLWVDIATARTEFYPYPAANPEVEASSIRQDLYRRDFTINALAIRLTSPRSGEMLDFFGGLLDLQSKHIRVLHANSFIEDPTRIYRAVRFAVRLGFQIEPQTEGYIRHAIASGIYDRIQHKNGRAPALETRLKSELKYILQAPYWKSALQMLAYLGALRCIHTSLELEEKLWWQVRLVDRCLQRFDRQKNIHHWQMRLEVLLAYLSPEYRGKVANNLQLSVDSIERLYNLEQDKQDVAKLLSQHLPVSKIVAGLRQYKLPTLILISVQSPRSIRQLIWRYLTQWSHIQAPLNGNDLKTLGYKPGRQFKQILDELLAATLDGKLGVTELTPQNLRLGAENFIALHFPLHKN